MFGVPINGVTNIFCDNIDVCVNTMRTESTQTKKNHIFSYHHIQESVAVGTERVSKDHTLTNLAGMFTNTMAALRRVYLLDRFTY